MRIRDLLGSAARRLETVSETPQLDAQVLLAHVTAKSRAWVIAHPEYEIEVYQLEPALKKLEAGEPLPYVLGKWEFFGLEFDITKDVLIPRPETELLVEKAIAWLKALERPMKMLTVADIGTGSGAIAVSVAKNVPAVRILATDISGDAIEVAIRNSKKFNLQNRVSFVECDLLPKSKAESRISTFDLLCSNPPYIPTHTLRGLPIFGREPTLALDGGPDGLNFYRRLFRLAPDWIAVDGMMLLEIESSFGKTIHQLAHASFPAAKIQLHQDLAGNDRLVEIQFHAQL